jgi:hypothetical protein
VLSIIRFQVIVADPPWVSVVFPRFGRLADIRISI